MERFAGNINITNVEASDLRCGDIVGYRKGTYLCIVLRHCLDRTSIKIDLLYHNTVDFGVRCDGFTFPVARFV